MSTSEVVYVVALKNAKESFATQDLFEAVIASWKIASQEDKKEICENISREEYVFLDDDGMGPCFKVTTALTREERWEAEAHFSFIKRIRAYNKALAKVDDVFGTIVSFRGDA